MVLVANHDTLGKEVTPCRTYLRSRDWAPAPSEQCLLKLFRIFLYGRFAKYTYILFSPFYLFSHLYQNEFRNTYFILWAIMPYNFICIFAQVVPAMAIKSSFNWLLYPFNLPPPVCAWASVHVCVSMFLFTALKCVTGLSWIISVQILESVIFPRIPSSSFFFFENGIRNQVLGTGVLKVSSNDTNHHLWHTQMEYKGSSQGHAEAHLPC